MHWLDEKKWLNEYFTKLKIKENKKTLSYYRISPKFCIKQIQVTHTTMQEMNTAKSKLHIV